MHLLPVCSMLRLVRKQAAGSNASNTELGTLVVIHDRSWDYSPKGKAGGLD
jgi:hypothetical protein